MDNLTQAVQVAVFVREYIRKNTLLDGADPKEISKLHKHVTNQVKNISGLK